MLKKIQHEDGLASRILSRRGTGRRAIKSAGHLGTPASLPAKFSVEQFAKTSPTRDAGAPR